MQITDKKRLRQTVQLTPELYDDLRKRSEIESVPMSTLMRKFIAKGLETLTSTEMEKQLEMLKDDLAKLKAEK